MYDERITLSSYQPNAGIGFSGLGRARRAYYSSYNGTVPPYNIPPVNTGAQSYIDALIASLNVWLVQFRAWVNQFVQTALNAHMPH